MSYLNILASLSKAILAALIAAGSSLIAIMSAGNASFSEVTGAQWTMVALAGLVALAAVYGVPNKAPSAPSATPPA